MKNLNLITLKSFCVFCFLLCISSYCFSQTNIVDAYKNHHKYPQEEFHLRFNKEAFYPGEKAWFEAFVTNSKSGRLFEHTKKVSLLIYDHEGKLIAQKYLQFQQGISNSFIQIPATYKASTLFYKLTTNWSKNFDTNKLYELKVYTKEKGKTTESLLNSVSFFPESGHIIHGINSFTGVKVVDKNGDGIIVSGKIKDENNKVVAIFRTDISGIGKFRFRPNSALKYFAEIDQDSEYRKFALPQVKSSGILISVVEKEDSFSFYFKSKDFSPKDTLAIIIHSKGNVALSSPINLKGGQVFFSLPKRQFSKGLNTITLFDGTTPLAERHFFNSYGISSNREDVLVKAKRASIDSVEFQLRNWLPNSQMYLSVSIVPEENLLVKKNTFKTHFYLGNLTKGFNYFNSTESISKINTHLLTYTEDKGKWTRIITQDTTNIEHPFETGFTIKGKLLDRKKKGIPNAKVDYYTDHQIGYVNTDASGNFLLKDLIVNTNDKVILSAKKGKGSQRQISFEVSEHTENHDTIVPLKKKQTIDISNTSYSPFVEDSELLKEVVVKGNATTKDDDTYVNPMDKSTFNESFKVTKDLITKYRDVLSYLSTRGGVRVINSAGSIYIYSTRTKDQTILGRNNFGVDAGSPGNMMNVYVNRTLIRPNQFEILKEISLDQVKSIKINRSGIGDGGKNPFGSINIYLTNESIFGYKDPTDTSVFRHEFFTKNGFSKSTPYEAPNYLYDPYSNEYKKHATLYWKPNIMLADQPYTFRVEVPENIQRYKVVIQGMTSNGDIIDFTKEISLQ